ncbi:MAG: ethanolamine utilization protein EutN [Caldiserica bacterium]|mgnify:CR=1 FL=1|nr:MAG: ethanolamine utilization protein EutN [Caldisericota bacterium]RLD18497.1 MAG: ethanolamine utilization protein EutN [Caldisericota bacterium]
MQFALVIGNVVCTQKDEKVPREKLLLVQPLDINWKPKGNPLVAVDAVGAGEGELVLIVSGSSARQTKITQNRPVDTTVMAIVDYVEKEGKIVFDKHKMKLVSRKQ